MTKTLQELKQEIQEKQKEYRELKQKNTFKGVYSTLRGRDSFLVEIKNSDVDNESKFENAVAELKKYLDSLEN